MTDRAVVLAGRVLVDHERVDRLTRWDEGASSWVDGGPVTPWCSSESHGEGGRGPLWPCDAVQLAQAVLEPEP